MRFVMTVLLSAFLSTAAHAKDVQTAIFAGGCFWCVEKDMESLKGVISAVSGFSGGSAETADYKTVTKKSTEHREAVLVTFDADVISYESLVDVFFRSIDPHDAFGSFCDRGNSYRTAIFATNAQAPVAKSVKANLQQTLDEDIYTPILPAKAFFAADDYHQDYYKSKDKVVTRFGVLTKAKAYSRYRKACKRDARVKEIWGKRAAFAK
ncbi:MAG: peptide-methionine (S)-S-oxide reductase MsrA [Pseudomonadota bacterium]